MLRARSVEPHDAEIRGEAFSVLGTMHSAFGRMLPTEDLDGLHPYLDPHQPIPREHMDRAAAKAGIAAADLEAQISSLNEHFGWDITLGARPATAKPKPKKSRRRTK